jgi:ribonuclease HI
MCVFKELEAKHIAHMEKVIREECDNLSTQLRHNPHKAYKLINNITGQVRAELNVLGRSTNEKLRKIREYFAGMGGDAGDTAEVKFLEAPMLRRPIKDGGFTLAELKDACKQFDRGKAPGCDGLPIESFMSLIEDPEVALVLLNIINEPMRTGEVPQQWKRILQVPIPKKGDLLSLSNWRPICLLNVIAKIHNKLIYNRIVPEIDRILRPNQFGFRPNRNTAGAMACLVEIQKKALRGPKGVVVCFVDFCKAFPSVSFAAIHAALRAFHVPESLQRAVMAMYTGTRAYVRTPLGDTDDFDVTTGTLQGDVLAPFLFILVLDRVLAQAFDENPQSGVTVSKEGGTRSRPGHRWQFSDLGYADDLALFAPSVKSMGGMLEALLREAGVVNLKMNVGPQKTAWMCWGNVSDAGGALHVEGLGEVPRVYSYKHLGSTRDETGTSVALRERIHLGWAGVHKLSPIWKMPFATAVKLRLFDTFITPILRYGAGTWTLSPEELEWGDVQVNRMRRYALGARFQNTNVLSLYGDTPKLSTINKVERSRLIGHLIRRGDSEVFASAMAWQCLTVRHTTALWRMSLSEACARDMGIDHEEILHIALASEDEASMAKARWQRGVAALGARLEPTFSYVPLWDARWEAERKRCTAPEHFELVEEGSAPFPHFPNYLHCYTDGSRIQDTDQRFATGSSVYAIQDGECVAVLQVPISATSASNNEAEIGAAIYACRLATALGSHKVIIHTDSGVLWDWHHNKRRRWRLTGYTGMPNADLYRTLDADMRELERVHVVKVRAHNGNPYNTEADGAAGRAANEASVAGHGAGGPRFVPQVGTDPREVDRALRLVTAARRRQREAKVNERTERKRERESEQAEIVICGHLRNHRFIGCREGVCRHPCCNRGWNSWQGRVIHQSTDK